MNPLKTPMEDRHSALGSRWVALILSVLALGVSLYALYGDDRKKQTAVVAESTLSQILQTGVLSVGYGAFPPYTMVDPKEPDPDKRVQGFSADLIREIAARTTPPLRVQWHSFSWDSLKAEVDSRRFDLIADPVYQTIPRASEFRLSRPYSYFGIAVAVVRKDDDRFKTFADLDREGIVIALAEGWTSSEFARKNLTKPTFRSIPVTGDAFTQLDEVRLGRVDVALNDVPTVAQYVRAHSNDVKALWLDHPPSLVPAGFLVREGNPALAAFLDNAVAIFTADGTLDRLDQKWHSFGYIPTISAKPGLGLPTPIRN